MRLKFCSVHVNFRMKMNVRLLQQITLLRFLYCGAFVCLFFFRSTNFTVDKIGYRRVYVENDDIISQTLRPTKGCFSACLSCNI